MKKLIIAIVLAILVAGCTNEQDATRILHAHGYTDIKFTGYNFFACSEDDTFHTGFIAKTATGDLIKGTVCSGFLFKNSTIRFE